MIEEVNRSSAGPTSGCVLESLNWMTNAIPWVLAAILLWHKESTNFWIDYFYL